MPRIALAWDFFRVERPGVEPMREANSEDNIAAVIHNALQTRYDTVI